MKKLLIDTYTNKVKLVLLENNEIIDVSILDKSNPNIVGNIYLGRVEKIVNKQFCFVKIGENQNCFIDMKDSKESIFKEKNITEGSKIIVEIVKNSTHDKVAKATTEFTLWNKGFLHFFQKRQKEIRISKSIKSKVERERLKGFYEFLQDGHCLLFRTASSNKNIDEIKAEYDLLVNKMNKLIENTSYLFPPTLLIENAISKEIYNKAIDVNEIITNSNDIYEILLEKMEDKKLTLSNDMVIDFTIQDKIEKLFNKKVWLKSGGYIYIEETESAVFIDVNSGKFIGAKNQEKASLKTNIEALEVSFKEIRLRNLSGIILIDLINLSDKENIVFLESKIRELLKFDSKQMSFDALTNLFLLQLTRKKDLGSLKEMNTKKCPNCNGQGYVFDINFLCDKIFRKFFWYGENTTNKKFAIYVSECTGMSLKKENLFLLDIVKEKFGFEIEIIIDKNFYNDFYEIKVLG
ncbi:MAG: ribonuclease E/G [Lachnospirales bacterium]